MNGYIDYFDFCKEHGIISHTMNGDDFIFNEDSVLTFEMATECKMSGLRRDCLIEMSKGHDHKQSALNVWLRIVYKEKNKGDEDGSI